MAGVAQLVRASDCGSEGRGFESRRLPHLKSLNFSFKMDVIFFAVIAFYIFFKLREQLGKVSDDEKTKIQEKISQIKAKEKELIAQQSAAITGQIVKTVKAIEVQNQNNDKILSGLDTLSKEHFLNALKSCNISAEFFVNGAQSSFQMIIKAFAECDFQTLKFLLSEKIYQGFEASINQRRSIGESLVSNLISIDKSEIISALIMDNIASVKVKFVSKQINYVADNSGNITQGRKDEIKELTDVWTFKKDLTMTDPNWVVIST